MVLNLDEEKLARQQAVDEAESFKADQKRGRSVTMSRLNFLKLGLAGGFGLLGLRLADMQLNRGQQSQQDNKSYIRLIQTNAPRGIIYDSKGNLIAENVATYNAVITPSHLPPITATATSPLGKKQLADRQAVYDNLARFLGMDYWVGVIPEQVMADSQRNVIINALSDKLKMAALDVNKRLEDAVANKTDKNFMLLNPVDLQSKKPLPISISDFDKYVSLRDLNGVYFISDGQKAVLLSAAVKPEYEPVVVWNKELSREDALRLEERRFDMPGVSVQTGFKRQYADPHLYSHILGYMGAFASTEEFQQANTAAMKDYAVPSDNSDNSNSFQVYGSDDKIGRAGIEYTMESYLRGRKGGHEVEVDVSNRIINTIAGSERLPQPGNNIYITIDPDIQNAATLALEAAIADANKTKGNHPGVRTASAVVLDARTGEVKALVSYPTYDNNLFNNPLSDKNYNELFDPTYPKTINYCISGGFAPGSTFKLITASAGLQEKNISLDTAYVCHGTIAVPYTSQPTPTQTYKCWSVAGHGPQNVVQAVENSCDIFFYNVAAPAQKDAQSGDLRYYEPGNPNPILFRGIGIEPLNKYMTIYGLGQKTGIELPFEIPGVLPGPQWKFETLQQGWSLGDTITTSIGQDDILMTPLQVANMTLAVATGKLYKPSVLASIKNVDTDGKETGAVEFPRPIPRDVPVDKAYLDAIRQGMSLVTSVQGTAGRLATDMGRLKVAGKTGTAEYGEAYEYTANKEPIFPTHAWFTSYAPYENPEYVVTVVLQAQAGTQQIEGSTYAVPAVKQIYQSIYAKDTRFFDQPTPTPSGSPNATGKPTTPTPTPKH